MMTCPVCSNPLHLRSTVHTISRTEYHLTIYELPLWMCQGCGQALYTEVQVDALEQLIRQTDEAVASLIDASG